MHVVFCKSCGTEMFSKTKEDGICGMCEENEKLKTALREIKDMSNRYNEKGYALNPDKVIQIIEKALKD